VLFHLGFARDMGKHQPCYLVCVSRGRPTVCNISNDPSEPRDTALCVSALCIYSSLDHSHAFMMLMGMLNGFYWSGFNGCIIFSLSWYVALSFHLRCGVCTLLPLSFRICEIQHS
jgi:hypothetical protein